VRQAAGGLSVLLTRRSDALPHHAGQYSFPGGARELGDADEVATALREAHEELGIDLAVVMVLGRLDDVWTPSGFLISTVVGDLPYPLSYQPHDWEVEAVVPVPYSYRANPEAVEEQELVNAGLKVLSPVYHYRSHRIWGATARIVADLVDRLTGEAAAMGA
jgi:8-oxo-dGTP pyrophosphatase MutT (NUDIX family)